MYCIRWYVLKIIKVDDEITSFDWYSRCRLAGINRYLKLCRARGNNFLIVRKSFSDLCTWISNELERVRFSNAHLSSYALYYIVSLDWYLKVSTIVSVCVIQSSLGLNWYGHFKVFMILFLSFFLSFLCVIRSFLQRGEFKL